MKTRILGSVSTTDVKRKNPPRCNKSHCYPIYLSPQSKYSAFANKSYESRLYSRVNALSYFLSNSEELKEEPFSSDSKGKLLAKARNVYEKAGAKFLKSASSPSTANEQSPNLFVRKGNTLEFNYQHCATIEEIVQAYIQAGVCSKGRLKRVDRKKMQSTFHEIRGVPNPDSQGNELDSGPKKTNQINDDEPSKINNRTNSIQSKSNTVKVEKNYCRKLNRRLDRISATHNIVLEFDHESQSSHDKTWTCDKSKVFNEVKTTKSKDGKINRLTTLPKLVSSVPNMGGEDNLNSQVTLPSIGAQAERLRQCNIFARSNWQNLRDKLSVGENIPTCPRTKKLLENLDKVSRGVQNFQRTYMEAEIVKKAPKLKAPLLITTNNADTNRPMIGAGDAKDEMLSREISSSLVETLHSWNAEQLRMSEKKEPSNSMCPEMSLDNPNTKLGCPKSIKDFFDKYSLSTIMDEEIITDEQIDDVSKICPTSEVTNISPRFDTEDNPETSVRDIKNVTIPTELHVEEFNGIGKEIKPETPYTIGSLKKTPLNFGDCSDQQDSLIHQALEEQEIHSEPLLVVPTGTTPRRLPITESISQVDNQSNKDLNVFVTMSLPSVKDQIHERFFSQISKSKYLKTNYSLEGF